MLELLWVGWIDVGGISCSAIACSGSPSLEGKREAGKKCKQVFLLLSYSSHHLSLLIWGTVYDCACAGVAHTSRLKPFSSFNEWGTVQC